MSRTIVLYGRATGIEPGDNETTAVVPWKDAFNFQENAGYMIDGEYENAVILPVNSTPNMALTGAVHISVDRGHVNFKEFRVEFWLGELPYAKNHHTSELAPLDFDWVAYVPCFASVRG
ncbi:MAG: hypothetical protein AKCLJLPJ_00273 [Fimbriimonadales bacterium]|nr:hypothetical protein [Fimbriimonadales bacterium]MDL1927521.1 hypothetical protein [Fimbriimonadia bacterium ATM]NOG92267.1 hypothetical protein [Armatimonadota bacterium]